MEAGERSASEPFSARISPVSPSASTANSLGKSSPRATVPSVGARAKTGSGSVVGSSGTLTAPPAEEDAAGGSSPRGWGFGPRRSRKTASASSGTAARSASCRRLRAFWRCRAFSCRARRRARRSSVGGRS